MIKNIIFDFDGVILDSIFVKTEAFKKLFQEFPNENIQELLEYHKLNGGISRYKKIEYFFNVILKQEITESEIFDYATRYSYITKEELTNPKYIILDAINFIRKNYKMYNLHIASGADENDLKYICDKLNLTKFFLSINGSPVIKSKLVSIIMINNEYKEEETILIGDSINDYDAAKENNINFYAYNNKFLDKNFNYIKNLENFKF